MLFSAGAALRTIRSATKGASIDEPKGLCSWQAPGTRAPARGHSCRPAEAAASCSCYSSACGRRRKGLPEGTPRLPDPHGNDPLQLGLYSVDNKIQALPKKKDRRRATKALRHLLTCTDSAYQTFYDLHPDFLRRHGTNVEEKLRNAPELLGDPRPRMRCLA